MNYSRFTNSALLRPDSTTDLYSESDFRWYRDFFKRIFDLFLCALSLPIAIPIILILMLLIKLTSKGPAIYRSERIGKDGRKFQCLKLRTMFLDADQKLSQILKNDPELKAEWDQDQKLKNDPRVTSIGKFIRALSLDELPQIFNVLLGEMSFVGPRPIVEEEIKKYGNHFKNYIRLSPGITGAWQVSGRNDTSYTLRINLDKNYSESANFINDLKIILKTIPVAISQKGAY